MLISGCRNSFVHAEAVLRWSLDKPSIMRVTDFRPRTTERCIAGSRFDGQNVLFGHNCAISRVLLLLGSSFQTEKTATPSLSRVSTTADSKEKVCVCVCVRVCVLACVRVRVCVCVCVCV